MTEPINPATASIITRGRFNRARPGETKSPPVPTVAIELLPGMEIRDCTEDRRGVIVKAFADLGMCFYQDDKGEHHSCRIKDVLIEPAPEGHTSILALSDLSEAWDEKRRVALRCLDDAAFFLGDAITAITELPIETHYRKMITDDQTSVLDAIRGAITDLYTLRANLTDELIGNLEFRGAPASPASAA